MIFAAEEPAFLLVDNAASAFVLPLKTAHFLVGMKAIAKSSASKTFRHSQAYNSFVHFLLHRAPYLSPRRRLIVELLGDGPNFHLPTMRKEFAMFTRIVECYVKKEKRQEFNDKLQNHVLPILQSQPGFVDLLALSSEDEPDRTISVSLWKSKADAERYHRAHYHEIVDSIRVLLRDEPSVEFYNVETSTAHKVTMGKAA